MKNVAIKSWNALGTTGRIFLACLIFFIVCKAWKR